MFRSARSMVALVLLMLVTGCQSLQTMTSWMRPGWSRGEEQAVESHEVLPVNRQAQVSADALEHADVSVPGPDDPPSEAEQSGFWSRLRSPSRFLLPRTDAWLGEEDTEVSQGFDSGF